jgi:superfamily I DNA/RNA helicase
VRESLRSVALTAGPGAGKTELLAQRADFLLRTSQCSYPRRILAISFKVAAARNLFHRVGERCGYDCASRLDSHTFHAFAKRLIDRYRAVLTGIDALAPDYTIQPTRVQGSTITFEDLVPLAVKIIEQCDTARSAICQTYSHVFLDEFQDCTSQQYELIRLIFCDSAALVTAVGDTKQRIMAWAGALEGIFERYAQDFDAISLNLYQNYRSQSKLRRMQNRMIEVMAPAAALTSDAIEGDSGQIEVWIENNEVDEAKAVSRLVGASLNDGVAPSEIAVIVAKQLDAYAAPLMNELDRRGIAYRNEAIYQDLLTEPIVRLIFDLLTVVTDQRQPDTYRRLVSVTEQLASSSSDSERLTAAAARYIRTVSAQIIDGRLNLNREDAARSVFDGYVDLVGVTAVRGLSSDYEDATRFNELIDSTFDRLREKVGAGFTPVQALRRLTDNPAVRILTAHKAKGLEFDLVVFLGIEEEMFFGNPSDERAVFFVGISRAKRHLVLTATRTRTRPPGVKRWKVARTPHAEFIGYARDR